MSPVFQPFIDKNKFQEMPRCDPLIGNQYLLLVSAITTTHYDYSPLKYRYYLLYSVRVMRYTSSLKQHDYTLCHPAF